MARYLLAHDIGTSGDKAALFTLEGTLLGVHTEAYPTVFAAHGYAEQNPEDWWQAFCTSNRCLLEGRDPADVACVGVSGQMMACIPYGAEGKPLRPAMIWSDQRAHAEADTIRETVGLEDFYREVGMRISAGFALPKMLWFRHHEPQLYDRTTCFLSVKDTINYRLTGRMATDPEDAAYLHCSRLKGGWATQLLARMGLDSDKLPEIVSPGTLLGRVRQAVAEEAGLAAGTSVAMATGDGDAAAIGAGVTTPGKAYTSIGTSSWVSVMSGTGQLDPECNLTLTRYLEGFRYSGTMQAGGFSYQWMRRLLAEGVDGYPQMNQLAEAVPAGSHGTLFLPYLLGERAPYWDPEMRGAWLGLSRQSDRGTMIRSVLEGVAFHLGMIFKQICALTQAPQSMRMIGGGAKSALWRQIFADMYGVPVEECSLMEHAGALGVAVLSGIAIGHYAGPEVVDELQTVKSITYPNLAVGRLYADLARDQQRAVRELAAVQREINNHIH